MHHRKLNIGAVCATLLFSATALFAQDAAQQPVRLVTLGGAVTEIVYALGMGEQIVGVDSSSAYPEPARALPQVGYHRALSAEGVLSLKPTMILMTEAAGPPDAIEQIRQSGVETLSVTDQTSLEGCVERIAKIAAALHKSEAGAQLAQSIQERLRAIEALNAQQAKRPKTLFIFAQSEHSLTVAGTQTAADAIIRLAGGENVVADYAGYRPFNAESAVELRPEVIIICAHNANGDLSQQKIVAHPGMQLTPAVKNNRVRTLDTSYLLNFGPRLGAAARDLHQALYAAQ